MHTKKELDNRLREARVQPLKKLGQNFLVNPEICTRIVERVASFKPQSVIEIGPGLGALTDELLLLEDTKILLIEIDSGLVNYWRAKFPQVEILHEDALRTDFTKLDFKRPCVIVSNLPYSIAASLVVEMSVSDFQVDGMILMFQKEVAQRITAPLSSPDYGMLSVVAQAHWSISTLIDAGPQDFHPVPNVGSRVLELRPTSTQFDRKAFLKFVKIAFEQRRKKLSTNLSARYKKDQIVAAFEALGLKEMARAQELDVATFKSLFETLEGSL